MPAVQANSDHGDATGHGTQEDALGRDQSDSSDHPRQSRRGVAAIGRRLSCRRRPVQRSSVAIPCKVAAGRRGRAISPCQPVGGLGKLRSSCDTLPRRSVLLRVTKFDSPRRSARVSFDSIDASAASSGLLSRSHQYLTSLRGRRPARAALKTRSECPRMKAAEATWLATTKLMLWREPWTEQRRGRPARSSSRRA